MKVNLIFGYTGFLAKNLYSQLIKKKQKVFVITRQVIKKKNFISLNLYNKQKIGLILDKIKPDYIWNMIGINSINLKKNIAINYDLSKFIIETDYNLKFKPKILLIGSIAEYGDYKKKFIESDSLNPINNYGLSKSFQSIYALNHAKQFKTKIIIARVSNIFGENMSDKFFLKKAYDYKPTQKNKTIIYKNFKRDYIHIDIVIKMLYKLMHNGATGEVYNIGSGVAKSNFKIFREILNKHKVNINMNNIEIKDNKTSSTIYFDIRKFNLI